MGRCVDQVVFAMSPIVTRLVAQKRRRGRVNVYLDGQYAFSLADVLAASLSIGQELDDDTLTRLRAEDAYQRGMDKALSLIAHRPRSIHEVEEALSQAEIPTHVQERIIARLQEMAYLNDRDFAQWWVENRTQFSPRSTRALRQELYQKGVPRSIIDEALLGLDDEVLALAAGRQRAYRWQHLPYDSFRTKLLGFLQRRGFGYEAARAAVNALWEETRPSSSDAWE